jgi:hypothetical protein
LTATTADAQFIVPNNWNQAQINLANNMAVAQTQGFAAGFNAGWRPGFGGFHGNFFVPPVQGYLQGVAAVTNANAQYQVTIQQARLAQVQADQARLDVRRRIREEREYELARRPTPEQIRTAEMRATLARVRNNPPDGDIWSAVALNALLTASQGYRRLGLYGPAIPLDPEVLRHVNVTTGTRRGSTGALNYGQPLNWPLALRSTDTFDGDRSKLDKLVAELVRQATSSQGVEADTLRDAQAIQRGMETKLLAMVADLTPDQFISSRRFLNELRDSLRTLEDPNAGRFLSHEWAARASTVGELVDEMTRQGLRFAPAVLGNEPSYTILFQWLAAYDAALSRSASLTGLQSPDP